MIDLNCQEFLDQLKNSEFSEEHPLFNHQKQVLKACKLLQKDSWLIEPNSYFFNKSPLEVILLGEGEAIIELLESRNI
jgi:hypothetical protein